jgi:hypothetical protein
MTTCEQCGGSLPPRKKSGPAARTCSGACRKAASRAHQAAAAGAIQAHYTAELSTRLTHDQEPPVSTIPMAERFPSFEPGDWSPTPQAELAEPSPLAREILAELHAEEPQS